MGRTARRTPGDGSLYQRADGMWVASLSLGTGPSGKRRRWTAKSSTHEGALLKLRKARADLSNHGDIPTASPTLDDWLRTWLRDIVLPRAKPRTYTEYESTVRIHISPVIGKVRLSRLTPEHIRRAMAESTAAGRLATANKIHATLSTALTAAEREALVMRNVARLTSAPSTGRKPQASLTSAQARSLLVSTVGTPLASRWLMALLTGARQGEVLGLEWARVDLDSGIADVSWQLQRLPYLHGCGTPPTCGKTRVASCPARRLNIPAAFEARPLEGSFVLTRPKTASGQRILPLPATLVVSLRAHRDAEDAATSPYGLVWCTPTGGPIDPKDDSTAWDRALRDAGLPDVKLHAARHTTATLLLEMGIDAKVIQQLLGHTDVITTRGYQTVSLGLARQALDGLGTALEA